MNSDMPKIIAIKRWRIKPGDRLLVHVEGRIDHEQADYLERQVRTRLNLPDEIKVVIVDAYLNLEVAHVGD